MRRKALITGISGQDGSYLAQLLLLKGYEVHGIVRRASSFNTARLRLLLADDKTESAYKPGLFLHYGDVTDGLAMSQIIGALQPDEFYNLAAQSHVRVSFDVPAYTAHATGLATMQILESIRSLSPNTRFYQASSSELYGSTPPPQNELSRFHPRSPYGVAKIFSFWSAVNSREAHGLFATNGILFNHESPRRGDTFVTRKIVKAAVEISRGIRDYVALGNLEAKRDWGYAPEFVGAMWKMLQQDEPSDFVVATGQETSVSEFAEKTFASLGLDFRDYVRFDERLLRPSEVEALVGDASKARDELGWAPSVKIDQLVEIMVEEEIRAFETGIPYLDTPPTWGVPL